MRSRRQAQWRFRHAAPARSARAPAPLRPRPPAGQMCRCGFASVIAPGSTGRPSPRVRLHQGDRKRMAQPAQEASIRLPQDCRFSERLTQPLYVSMQTRLLGGKARREILRVPGNSRAPHACEHRLGDDHNGRHDQQPDPDPGQVGVGRGHSFPSPSSIPATGAIATTWSSGASRITITPWVCRPMREMAPTGVRSTIPLALITSTSSSGSLTTRNAVSLPTLSVTLSVNTPCPARCLTGYSERGVRFPYPYCVMTRRSTPLSTVCLLEVTSHFPVLSASTSYVDLPCE